MAWSKNQLSDVEIAKEIELIMAGEYLVESGEKQKATLK